MKNKRRLSTFLTLDLADVIDLSGYIMLTGSGEQVYVTEYRRRVEARILHIVENHPTLQAIGRGQPVDELQLLALERTLQQELAAGDLEVTPTNLRKVYGVHIEASSTYSAWCWIWTHPRLRADRGRPIPGFHHPAQLQRRPDPLPARRPKRVLSKAQARFGRSLSGTALQFWRRCG